MVDRMMSAGLVVERASEMRVSRLDALVPTRCAPIASVTVDGLVIQSSIPGELSRLAQALVEADAAIAPSPVRAL